MIVYFLTHHGELMYDDLVGFRTEEEAEAHIKAKGYNSPWVSIEELSIQ